MFEEGSTQCSPHFSVCDTTLPPLWLIIHKYSGLKADKDACINSIPRFSRTAGFLDIVFDQKNLETLAVGLAGNYMPEDKHRVATPLRSLTLSNLTTVEDLYVFGYLMDPAERLEKVTISLVPSTPTTHSTSLPPAVCCADGWCNLHLIVLQEPYFAYPRDDWLADGPYQLVSEGIY